MNASDELDLNYAMMVDVLAKPGKAIRASLTEDQAELLHMAVGISGEAGELLDALKKHVIYNKPLDMDNVIEELGDLEFYMQGMRALLNLDRDQTLRTNMDKLSIRYAKGYSDQAAQVRADKTE